MNYAIIYTVDDNPSCIAQLDVSLRSVHSMVPGADVFILTNTPEASYDTHYGAKVIDVKWLSDQLQLSRSGINWRHNQVSPMMMMRLAIPLVPELQSYDRILYLDSDTELWSPDITDFISQDMQGHEIVAVRDVIHNRERIHYRINGIEHSILRTRYTHFNRINELKSNLNYINSGVLLFDLSKFKDTIGYTKRLQDILNVASLSHPKYPDQDIINTLYDVYCYNDRRFNSWGGSNSAYTCIEHYVGSVRKSTDFYPIMHRYRPYNKICTIKDSSEMGVFSEVADMAYVILDHDEDSDIKSIIEHTHSLFGISRLHYAKDTSSKQTETGRLFSPEVYAAVKDAYKNGSERAVFLWYPEAPIDKSLLHHQLVSIPSDFDIALLSDACIVSPDYRVPIVRRAAALNLTTMLDSICIMSRTFMRQYMLMYENNMLKLNNKQDIYFFTHSRLVSI